MQTLLNQDLRSDAQSHNWQIMLNHNAYQHISNYETAEDPKESIESCASFYDDEKRPGQRFRSAHRVTHSTRLRTSQTSEIPTQ